MRAAEKYNSTRGLYLVAEFVETPKLDIHLTNTERTAIIQIFAFVLANDSFFPR